MWSTVEVISSSVMIKSPKNSFRLEVLMYVPYLAWPIWLSIYTLICMMNLLHVSLTPSFLFWYDTSSQIDCGNKERMYVANESLINLKIINKKSWFFIIWSRKSFGINLSGCICNWYKHVCICKGHAPGIAFLFYFFIYVLLYIMLNQELMLIFMVDLIVLICLFSIGLYTFMRKSIEYVCKCR